jgi:general stress protein 26
MSVKDPSERIWQLMKDIGVAMAVTHSGDGGEVRARPMLARPEVDDNAIYFLTDADTPKDHEITHDSHICLAFADPRGQRFVSVTGTAEVYANSAMAERVWSAADKAFWKDHYDPRIRVIRVTPDQGQFWEGAGLIASVVSMITASAKSERPNFGECERVTM